MQRGAWQGAAGGGSLRCWGYNFDSELGNGSITDSSVPVLSNVSNVIIGETDRRRRGGADPAGVAGRRRAARMWCGRGTAADRRCMTFA